MLKSGNKMPRGVKPEIRIESGVRAFLSVKEGSLGLPKHSAGDDEKETLKKIKSSKRLFWSRRRYRRYGGESEV